ncbi:MAG TPA: DUF3293 domain-containing protein [Gemmatimonadaceae bacterium]
MATTPDEHDPDWQRYPETILIFGTQPAVEIDLRKTLPEAALSTLEAVGLGGPFAIITAFDPRGQDLSAAENEERRRGLDRRLSASGYKFARVDCCSPDRSHCECSVAVAMHQEDAIKLAKELEQMAIFWFDGERFWILGALVETEPMMLPKENRYPAPGYRVTGS